MPIHFDKDTSCWRFEFNRVIAGRRIRATKTLPKGWTRAQAQTYEQRETARLFALATGDETQRRTIEEAIEVYCNERLPYLKGRGIQFQELTRCHWAYAGRYIDELPDVAREYVANAIGEDGEPLAMATIRNRLAYIRAACRYAYKHHGYAQHDPAERMTLPSAKNERHHYVTRKEMLQIARRIRSRPCRRAVIVAFYSGMRQREILSCKLTEGAFLLEDTKNGERRMVPIHPKLKCYLGRMPIKAGASTISHNFKDAAMSIGLGHLRFHDLRHSTASALINAGIDLYTVGGILGHKNHKSTQRYAHLATDTLAAAVAKIGQKR